MLRRTGLHLASRLLLRAASLSLGAALTVACTSTGSVQESRPLEASFGSFRTCAVEVDAAGFPNGTNDGALFLSYFESELRRNGLLEPTPVGKGAELIVRTRVMPSPTAEDDVRMLVDFIDAKSRRTIGQVTVTGNALGSKSAAALRSAANEIVGYMRSHRGAVAKRAGGGAPAVIAAPAATQAPAAETPGVVTAGACTTTCRPDSTSTVLADDLRKVADAYTPMLKDMRACLDRVSAQAIHPVVILRFEGSVLTQLRSDTGGYDDLACVHEARSRAPAITIGGGANLRCEYRCAR